MFGQASIPPCRPARIDHRGSLPAHGQRGFALLMGLILLIMLSIVAVVVMKGSVLEAHLTTATARHEQAFEASEAARLISETVLKPSIVNFAGNWPTSWGGSIPDASFGLSTIFVNRTAWSTLLAPASGAGLQYACGGSTLINLLTLLPCSTQSATKYNYTPTSWQPAFQINLCSDGTTSCSSSQQIQAQVRIIRDGTISLKGCALNGGSYASGAPTCTATVLQIRSQASVPGNGSATTIAQYQFPNQ